MSSDWKKELKDTRKEKDRFFEESPDSPIPQEDRSEFEGLAYFPIDSDYRFELELHEHEEKETFTIDVTGEGDREYIRWGEFHFEIDGEEQVLHAYKRGSDEEGLFVPFRDSTCGEESYGAGRYLDLGEEDYLGDDKWVVDFNKVYNPWCAYSGKFSCPLPPHENWLEVPIYAGEKKYPLKK